MKNINIKGVCCIMLALGMLLTSCAGDNNSSSVKSSSHDEATGSTDETQSYMTDSYDESEVSDVSESEESSDGNSTVKPGSSSTSRSNSKSNSSGKSSVTSINNPSSNASSATSSTTPARQYYTADVGIWYNIFMQSEADNPAMYEHHWGKESRSIPVEDGRYSSANVKKIEKDFKYFTKIGIDYVVLDDTNGHGNDGGYIAKAADNCFVTADKLGTLAPKLCFAGGGPLLSNDPVAMQNEMDLFYAYYENESYRDNYFVWKGKPLFVHFTIPKNYGYQETGKRFTMRPAAGHTSEGISSTQKYGLDKIGMFGWVFDVQYEQSEVYGVWPGWSRDHNNNLGAPGTPPPEKSREEGLRYQKVWLAAVKRKPETIVIASWNDHNEENGIEAVTLTEQASGRTYEHLNPYYYQQMTEGYLALKTGYLENFYYQSEDSNVVYQYKNKKLNKVSGTLPRMTAVIMVPSDYFQWAGVARVG